MHTNKQPRYWFAMRLYYKKVLACRTQLIGINDVLNGINPPGSYFPEDFKGEPMDYYAPSYYDTFTDNRGKQVSEEKALIPSIFFFRSTLRQAECFEQSLPFPGTLYRTMGEEPHLPIRIPQKQMDMFMLVTSAEQDGLEYLDPDAYKWKKGVRVRVIDGKFKGLEGEIKRIGGNKSLVVAIEGICAVATSYIPQCFLERIE